MVKNPVIIRTRISGDVLKQPKHMSILYLLKPVNYDMDCSKGWRWIWWLSMLQELRIDGRLLCCLLWENLAWGFFVVVATINCSPLKRRDWRQPPPLFIMTKCNQMLSLVLSELCPQVLQECKPYLVMPAYQLQMSRLTSSCLGI